MAATAKRPHPRSSGLLSLPASLRARFAQAQKTDPWPGKPSLASVLLIVALLLGLVHILVARRSPSLGEAGLPFRSGGSPTDIIPVADDAHHNYYHPTAQRPYNHPSPRWCQNPQPAPYPDFLPVSVPRKMSSATTSPVLLEAARIAREFDYPATEVQRGVQAFINQMHEGLSMDGATLSQIPTYVTGVPNGTEKVRALSGRAVHQLHGFFFPMMQETLS